MKKVVILSDSTCDLTQDILEAYEIKTIPLYVNFGDNMYKDGVDLKTEDLYRLVAEKNQLPKTAAPSVGDFHDFFKPIIDEGYDIVYIGISSKLSSTLQSAKIAASEWDEGRIHIIDSYNLSSGIGLLVLKAATLAKEGLAAAEIEKIINQTVPKIKTAFMIDTLDYLHKGGRCSSMANIVSTVLKIKPIIHVVNGEMIVGQKPRGKHKAYDLMIKQIVDDQHILDTDFVMVTHSQNDEGADYIKQALQNQLTIKQIYETNAGCVISSHCGKGTIGILYITK